MGADLELLDCFLGDESENLEYEDMVAILQYLIVNNVRLSRVWSRDLIRIWKVISSEILCRYMNKRSFLKLAGVLQNGRFITLLEDIPMTKLLMMADVYKEISEEQSEGA